MTDAIVVGARERALDVLSELDRRLTQVLGVPLTLDPTRERATEMRALGEILLADEDHPHVIGAFAQTLEMIVDAQLHNFPENIFWDFDYMAARLLHDGQRWPQGVVDYLRRVSLMMARLEYMFGCRSTIRFRYVHDFIYGFDWARWVGLDPEHRGPIGPYDQRFLRYVLQRGEQIVHLTTGVTSSYPLINPNEWRNMFAFRRDQEAEAALLRDLAASGMIPVMAWRIDAQLPASKHAYSDYRRERALALGYGLDG